MLVLLVCFLTWPGASLAQLDICGCTGNPNNLGAFDTTDEATYPLGTTSAFRELTIPLPPDGVLIFDSFTVQPRPSDFGLITVRFELNAANSPVTLLVTGDVTIASGSTLTVNGDNGTNGSSGVNGEGGLGGPGGFRGGDGAYQLVNFANDGGAGFGPGGGAPSTAFPLAPGSPGTFVGVPELLPLVGGSGGGGGASSSGETRCSAGGGGGGGGAILIAANGTTTVKGAISADGGNGGGGDLSSCSSNGAPGGGGAIRLVADTIGGTGSLLARGGVRAFTCCVRDGGPGRIRLEAITNTLSANKTDPVASRAPAPGPLANPLAPTVAITAVGGQAVPVPPLGVFGEVDIILPAPGVATVELATTGVPSGTTVKVRAKPRVGGAPAVVSTPLDPGNCDDGGNCLAAVAFDLPAGAYVIEARATFQTP